MSEDSGTHLGVVTDISKDVLEKQQMQYENTHDAASSGFSWTTDSLTGIDELLSQADEALYEIKRETKGRYGEYHKIHCAPS